MHDMKRFLIFFATVFVSVSCVSEASQTHVIDVVPYPNDVQFAQGHFNVKGAYNKKSSGTPSVHRLIFGAEGGIRTLV